MTAIASWYIIVNPCSGKRIYRKGIHLLKKALHDCNQTSELQFTQKEGHAAELARNAADMGYRQFVVIGGDGTLNEVINGIFSSGCTSTEEILVAAIPSGTGNDWIRQWNITWKTSLTDYFRSGKRILVDVGRIMEKDGAEKRSHYFLNAAGLGLDGDVVYRADNLRNWVGAQSWTYLVSVFLSVFKLRYRQLCIETAEEQIAGDVLTVCIGNGCYTGGGLMQTPKANPCDGLLDIMLVQHIRLRDIPSLLNALLKRRFDLHPAVKTVRSNALSISALQPIRCETDGVLLTMNYPLEIKLLPEKIQFLIP